MILQRHLLDLERLSKETILWLLKEAKELKDAYRKEKPLPSLKGKAVALLFREPSTRTRLSFERAAQLLDLETLLIDEASSSRKKGESLQDTAVKLSDLAIEGLVLRTSVSGEPETLARFLDEKGIRLSVVNGGDGIHEHPTQGLLDAFTLWERWGDLRGKTIAIVGDILHSRVARSSTWAFHALGAKVRLVGPPSLVPLEMEGALPARVYHRLDEGLQGVDAVMGLRIQKEREAGGYLPGGGEYPSLWRLEEPLLEKLAPAALFLHPGPAGKGEEVTADLHDGPRSLVEEQVQNGLFVRMAVWLWVLEAMRHV
ncbi:MAG: aspartate carbamoyltransferase catalytic subunit [Clostridiales bacterium]|nr:aspartate carbamoyltransferase catalytic subunit [Clostridiales bacterium]